MGPPRPGWRHAAGPRRRTAPGGRRRADAGRPHPGRCGYRAGVRAPPPVRGAATRRHGPCVEARRGRRRARSQRPRPCPVRGGPGGRGPPRSRGPDLVAGRRGLLRPVPGGGAGHGGGPDRTARRPSAATRGAAGRRCQAGWRQPGPGGGHPGRGRDPRHGAAGGQSRAPRPPLPRPRPGAPLARAGSRRRGGPDRRRVHRRALRADLRADGGLGGPAPVDPASRQPPFGPVRGGCHRPCDRHRAPPADRLRERARLPRARPGPGAGRDARARRGVLGRDGREPDRGRRRGHHRLGGPVPRATTRGRHRRRPAGDHHPRDATRCRRVDAARPDGPRGCVPGRRGAVALRVSASSPRTICDCW